MTPWPNFTRAELECKCGQCDYRAEQMSPVLMDWLQKQREILNFPFPVTSAIRCPHHNRFEGSKAEIHTPHGDMFFAIDLNLYRHRAWALLERARDNPEIVGIGMKMHGPDYSRFIHLDVHPTRGYRVEWTYS